MVFIQKGTITETNAMTNIYGAWIKEPGKQTCCPWILPGQNGQPSNCHKI